MNPANQVEEPTMETDTFRFFEPVGTVATLASLGAKVLARNPETFASGGLTNSNTEVDSIEYITEAARDLSYFKATPLDNGFFSMFFDGSQVWLSRLDLRDCRIDEAMLRELLVTHGRNLVYLNISQHDKFSGAAIPESLDFPNLHTLVLGDQVGIFSNWSLPGNEPEEQITTTVPRLITSACPNLRSLNIDLSKWNDIFGTNKKARIRASKFLENVLDPIRPVHLELANWNHRHPEEVLRGHLIDYLQSFSVQGSSASTLQSVVPVIGMFGNLHTLNISSFVPVGQPFSSPFEQFVNFNNPASTLFNLVQSLPLLESLDISGTNMTSPATGDDPIPFGPYRVASGIPGLRGLQKSLKFLSVCWCPYVNVDVQLPAVVVASFRSVGEQLNALRRYESRSGGIWEVLSNHWFYHDPTYTPLEIRVIDDFAPNEFQQFLDVVCSRKRCFAFLSNSSLPEDISKWVKQYGTRPPTERLDKADEIRLFERIRQIGLQFSEMILNKGDVVGHSREIYKLLKMVNDLSPLLPVAGSNEVYFSQLFRAVDRILAEGAEEMYKSQLHSVGSAQMLNLLGFAIQSQNASVRQFLTDKQIQARIQGLMKSAWEIRHLSNRFYGLHEIGIGTIFVLDSIWLSDSDGADWQRFVNDGGLGDLARIVYYCDGCCTPAKTEQNIRRFLAVLKDVNQPPATRCHAAALLVKPLFVHAAENDVRNEVWQLVINFWNKGTHRISFVSFKELVRCVREVPEEPTLQLWSFWSILHLRKSEILAEKSEIWRLRSAVKKLHRFADAGFEVPGVLLEMADNAFEKVSKIRG